MCKFLSVRILIWNLLPRHLGSSLMSIVMPIKCGAQTRGSSWRQTSLSSFSVIYFNWSRPGSSVGIATAYGLDGPGIESRWGRDFSHLSRPALRPTVYNGYRVFPGGKVRPGRDADPWTPSSAEVKNKSRATPLLPLRAFVACERVKPTYFKWSSSFSSLA